MIGTTLCGTFILNSSSALFHWRLGNVNVRAAALIATLSALSGAAVAMAAIEIDEQILRRWLAVALVASSVGFFR